MSEYGMYDRMGDLLSEFLDNGQLPPERKSSDAVTTEETERNENRLEIPVHLCADFARLGFSSESGVPSYSECRRAYKKKLLQSHPDLKNDNPVLQKAAAKVTKDLLFVWQRISAWYKEQCLL